MDKDDAQSSVNLFGSESAVSQHQADKGAQSHKSEDGGLQSKRGTVDYGITQSLEKTLQGN